MEQRVKASQGEAQELAAGYFVHVMYYMGSGLQSENNLLFLLFPLKWCFWKKKKKTSSGLVDGAFLERREVGDKWDVDLRARRHAKPTN